MFPLLGIISCTTIGAFRGVHDPWIDTLPSRFAVIRRAELSRRHHPYMHERIVYARRERVAVGVGLGADDRKRRPQHIARGLGLVIREHKPQLLGHGGPCALGAPAGFAPAPS
jgi:hypothetical protein